MKCLKIKYLYVYLVIVLVHFSCSTNKKEANMFAEKNTLKTIGTIDLSKIDMLNNKRIYFGHMSVGRNILNGVKKNVQKHDIKLHVIEAGEFDSDTIENSYLLHSRIGKNGDPLSKILDFETKFSDSLISGVDIAFFKFCYIDFQKDTAVESVFKEYSKKMDMLIQKYPSVTFVHTTVPLREIQGGVKGFVKKLLGKSIGIEDNLARNKFNNLLREKYSKNSAIFDIAFFESTYQNGAREFVQVGDEICYSLISDYTYDGGHLNEVGEEFLGEQFLIFLSQTCK